MYWVGSNCSDTFRLVQFFCCIFFSILFEKEKRKQKRTSIYDHTIFAFFLFWIALLSGDSAIFNNANSANDTPTAITVVNSVLLREEKKIQNWNWMHVKYSKNIIINCNVTEKRGAVVRVRMSTTNVTS